MNSPRDVCIQVTNDCVCFLQCPLGRRLASELWECLPANITSLYVTVHVRVVSIRLKPHGKIASDSALMSVRTNGRVLDNTG